MFSQISWSAFFESVAIVSILYYAAILTLYYRSELLKLTALKFSLLKSDKTVEKTQDHDSSSEKLASIDDLYNSINFNIRKAGKEVSSKEELLFGLRSFIAAHQSELSALSVSKPEINNYVSNTVENICSIHLNEEDLQVLWV